LYNHEYAGDTTEPYYKYFTRYFDKNVLYPSISEVETFKDAKSTVTFAVPKTATFTATLDKVDTSETFCGISAKDIKIEMLVKERADSNSKIHKIAFGESTPIDFWNKVNGEVTQYGDAFYYADNVRFIR
jgi:hypothetical protein